MNDSATRGALLVVTLWWIGLGCGGGSGLKGGAAGTGGDSDAAVVGVGGMDASLLPEDGGGGVPIGGSTGKATGGPIGVGGIGADGAVTGGGGIGGTGTGGAGSGPIAMGGTGNGGVGTGGVATGGIGSGGSDATPTGGTLAGGARTGGTSGGGVTGGGTGGTITGAYLALDKHGMDFDRLVLGKSSVATFMLANVGTATAGVPVITTETDRYPTGTPTPITVTGCSGALPANGSCTLTVTVTPPKLGLFQGYVRIKADPGVESSLSIFVQGWSIAFEISPPTSVDFGLVAPGVPLRHSVTVTALAALSDLELYASGEDISIDEAATTCTATLAVGASCVATARFLATTVGWKEGVIGFKAGGDAGQIMVVGYTANVSKASDLTIDPSTPQSFQAFFLETTRPIVFIVTNVGDTTSGPIHSSVVGDYSWDFAISDTDCTTLAPRAICSISVVCSPGMSASSAPREVVLSVTDGNTHLAVPLTATISSEM